MKRYLLLLVWCFGICSLRAQTPDDIHADSLVRLVQQAPNDSVKIERLLDLSFFWSDRDTTRAYQYIAEAVDVIGDTPTDYYQGLIHLANANVIYDHDIERAKASYMLADRFLAGSEFPRAYYHRSRAWNNYGTLLQRQDSSTRFMDVIIEHSLPNARLSGDSLVVGDALNNIGVLLSNIQDFEKAEAYFKQALQAYSEPSLRDDRFSVFATAANNAILGDSMTRARVYLDSAAAVFPTVPHSLHASYYYRTEGLYFRHMGQTQRALAMFEKGLDQARALHDEDTQADINFEIYNMYRHLGDYENARKYLLITGQYPLMSDANRLVYLRELAQTEFNLGNFREAYQQMQQYALGKDTFQENNMALKILDLEKK